MCGRYACSLGPDEITGATCCYDPKTGVYKKTSFAPNLNKYTPSFNIPPTKESPAIVSNEQAFLKDVETDRVLISMKFGIQGFGQDHGTKTMYHLCTLENLPTSKLFKPMVNRGGRCAIPVTGYYEWQTDKAARNLKQPYFFYNSENSDEDILNVKGNWNAKTGWDGVKLLYLAAIFISQMDEEGNPKYSFALITRQTQEEWMFVHYRMPVILETDEDLKAWINVKSSSVNDAIEILKKPVKKLTTHPVNCKEVNSTENRSEKCVQKISLEKPPNILTSWLNNKKDKDSNSSKFKSSISPTKTSPTKSKKPDNKRKSSESDGPLAKLFKKMQKDENQ